MKTDSFFYEFFLQFPQAFFALIGQDTQKAAGYTFKSVEVKGQPFRVDGIFLPKSKTDVLYFVEVQFGKDSTFYSRFFSEIFLYLRQYRPKNKWRAVVIFPEETIDPGVDHHYQEFFETNRLQKIYLSKLSKQQLESFPLNLLQIITAPNEQMSTVVKNVTTHVSKEIQDDTLKERIVDLVINLLLNKLSNLTREEIEKMTEPMISNIKKTRFYQEIRQEVLEEGIKKGIQQGIEKGIEKGIESGLRQTIYDILDIKFGTAGLRLFKQLAKTMSNETLENIRVGLKKADSIEEAEEIIKASVEK